MKRLKLIATIATLATAPVYADTFEMPNQSGGRIVLQESVCYIGKKKYEHLNSMFAVSGAGKSYSGCWYYEEGWVHVIYSDGTEYKYPSSAFTHLKSAKPRGTAI